MNANLIIEQVPELKSELSKLADYTNFVGQKLQHSFVWSVQKNLLRKTFAPP